MGSGILVGNLIINLNIIRWCKGHNMPSKTWKNRERDSCRFFGTERNPLSGGNGKHSRSDSLHEFLFIEHKHRKNQAVINLFLETEKLAKLEDKLPVVTLSQHGVRGFFVMCRAEDLQELANYRARAKRGEPV